jgi:hypothetical protein
MNSVKAAREPNGSHAPRYLYFCYAVVVFCAAFGSRYNPHEQTGAAWETLLLALWILSGLLFLIVLPSAIVLAIFDLVYWRGKGAASVCFYTFVTGILVWLHYQGLLPLIR